MYSSVDHRRSRFSACSQVSDYGPIAKVTPGVVRTMFDSCYLRPNENPRVIQDADPAKASVLSSAHSRHRQDQESQHQKTIDFDESANTKWEADNLKDQQRRQQQYQR